MAELYPLRFAPIFRRYLWGGRRLSTVLNKPIGAGDDYAESWEIVDHGQDQSVVSAGALKGKTLHELVRIHGEELFGRHHPQSGFPLLWKFLDAHRTLSVQVHPNDRQAALLDPPDLGKAEAWVVLDAAPGSLIYAGLKRGFDRPVVEREVSPGTIQLCLHRFEPAVGDCVFIPAGTLHAIGAGLLVAEIQQASDTTYRLFDWNRVGADGQPRELHLSQGLDAMDYDRGPVGPQSPRPTDKPHVSRLVECDKFVLDRWQFDATDAAGGDRRFHILAVLQGSVNVQGDVSRQPLRRGQTLLLPATAGEVRLEPVEPAVMLDAYLP